MISILGIQGDKVKELYDSDKEIYDFKCIRLEDTTKVFSKSLRKSYTLERNESMSVYDVSEMRINFKASRIREDIEGLEVGISKQYLLWDDGGGYGHAEYIYGFKNGEMACIDFQFRPNDNVKIRKTKGGISYDLFEEAQNKLIGFWDYEENPGEGQHGERHRIKITDERMIMYVVESERMDKYEYNILDYDENNQIIEMDIGTGICKFKFLDDNIMEITWNNGNKSIWNSVYNVFAQ